MNQGSAPNCTISYCILYNLKKFHFHLESSRWNSINFIKSQPLDTHILNMLGEKLEAHIKPFC